MPSGTPLGLPRAIRAMPRPETPEADPPAGAAPGETETPDENRGHSPDTLPPPLGADLITEMAAFDQGSDEEPLAWLLDRLRGDHSSQGQVEASPYLIHIVFTLVVF